MPRILLIEDDAMNAEIMTRILRKNNYEVIHASDGPTGVSLADSARPDLILMDMRMPHDGDGEKATREIRALPGLATTPIIALTAKCMPQEVEEMYQAGCSDVVTKPVHFPPFLEKITALLADGAKT